MTARTSSVTRAILSLSLGIVGAMALAGCGGSGADAGTSAAPVPTGSPSVAPKVTFVELGSDKCAPCKEMRPVMDAVQRTFGDQLAIVFYDVWEDEALAREYGIQYIPTQVFLDEDGVEFHRHTGFYPQEQIEAMLAEHGLETIAIP